MRKKNAQITESTQSNLSTLTGINDASVLALATDVGWSPGTYHVFDGTDMVRLPKMEYPVKHITGNSYTLTLEDTGFLIWFDSEGLDPATLVCNSDVCVVGFNCMVESQAGPVTITGTAIKHFSGNGTNVIPNDGFANITCSQADHVTIRGDLVKENNSICTHAALPTPSSAYTGQQRIVSDANNSVWLCDGTSWKPIGGRYLHWASTVASGVAPSGTINTGAAGNVTLGTAINKTYSYGVFLAFPAVATTPALSAGTYYCVASNTSTLTIHDTTWVGNVPTVGAPINFTVGASYTGITTRVECYTADAVTGNVLGNGGAIILEYSAAINNNANVKLYGVTFGSASGLGGNSNTNIAGYSGAVMTIQNQGDEGHQTYTSNPMTAPASMGVPGSSAQDTTTDKTISIGVTMSVPTDYYIFQQLNMWVMVQ